MADERRDAMNEEKTIENLTTICRRLGAGEEQAGTMARQLWKRSAQIAMEREIKQVEALDHLLSLMTSARNGGTPPQDTGHADFSRP